jgi:transposase
MAHDDPGITPLVARWRDRQPLLRVLEATGGLDVPVTAARTAAGWPVVVGPPRHARDVAHATGRLATTAAGEAHGLAHVAEAGRPAPRPVPEAQPQALSAPLARRRPRLARLTAEQNRLGSAPRTMQADIQAHLTGRERRRAALNKDLGPAMRARPVWREPDDRRPSPPAWAQSSRRRWLLTARRGGPAAGSRSRPWWASPRATGIVAPCGANRPSGGGRAQGRAVRSMSTLVAVWDHPVRPRVYARWRRAGQAPKVALTACMCQGLTSLKAMGNSARHGNNIRPPLLTTTTVALPADKLTSHG